MANRASKLGGKMLHSQTREVIFNLYNFMKREAAEGPILLQKVQKRVAEATGVSRSSVQRVLLECKKQQEQPQEAEQPVIPLPTFTTPKKKWKKKIKKTDLDDFDKTVVRRTIYEFHRTEGQRLTLKTLLSVLKDKIGFNGEIWALRQVLKQLAFRWKKAPDNRKFLIEKHEIREQRVRFIRAVQQYRREGRPIVYTDETYVHGSHTKPHSWSDDSNRGLLTPISKGQYAIIVHAGNDDGFIEGAMLIFKSGQKSGDYHDSMNFTNYKKWLEEKLIPNLPPKTVLVIDNAAYHNKLINPAPTSQTRKADMINWLIQHNVPWHERMLKPELYELIKLNKSPNKTFFIDTLLAQHGHSALRLPPYHPDLNPIEMIWSLIKNHVALKNTTFKLNDCIQLVNEKIAEITKEEWSKRCQHARDIEDNYMINEAAVDRLTETFIINLADDSESELSDLEPGNDGDSDAEMSGIESL